MEGMDVCRRENAARPDATYLMPVNADARDIQVLMIPERDEKVNPLGIKGIGELGTVGVNAAIASAVYHATASACAICRSGPKACFSILGKRPCKSLPL